MNATFEKAVIEEVTKKALKDIDIDALAKKLKPQLEKRIEKGLLEFLDDSFYWDNVFEEVNDIIEEMAVKSIKTALGKDKPKPTPAKKRTYTRRNK